MTTTISVNELKNNTSRVLDKAALKGNRTMIKRQGKPGLIIMSADEYESWEETKEILADKKLMRSIKRGEEDIKNGRYITLEDLKKELKLDV